MATIKIAFRAAKTTALSNEEWKDMVNNSNNKQHEEGLFSTP